MTRVTVVNDDPEFLELMGEVLQTEGFEATTIDGDRADVLDHIRTSRPEVLIVDLRMEGNQLHGWDVAQEMRRRPAFEALAVLLCSADLPALHALEAQLQEQRAVAVLPKPFGIDQLTRAVRRLLAESSGG
ncbi:MAG: response regulator [Chloroflexi bacterium]|nr:response regulator [Chloroflexota bacterium]